MTVTAEELRNRLNRELKSSGSQKSSYKERKNPLVRVNSKNSFFGRILPEPEDMWVGTDYSSVFVQFLNKDGSTFSIGAEMDVKDPEDMIANLTRKAISLNNGFRDKYDNLYKSKYGVKSTPDIISFDLNKQHKYHLNISNRVELIGIPVIRSNDGSFLMEQSPTVQGMPKIQNYDISYASYNTILTLINEGYQINGKPIESPLSFVTPGQTFPISIKYDVSQGKRYDVLPRTDIILPGLQFDYLQKDESGYVYIDNPKDYHKPLKVRDNNLYERVVEELDKKISAGIENGKKIASQLKTTVQGFNPQMQAPTPTQTKPTLINQGYQPQTTAQTQAQVQKQPNFQSQEQNRENQFGSPQMNNQFVSPSGSQPNNQDNEESDEKLFASSTNFGDFVNSSQKDNGFNPQKKDEVSDNNGIDDGIDIGMDDEIDDPFNTDDLF